jgi:hypothetical protein
MRIDNHAVLAQLDSTDVTGKLALLACLPITAICVITLVGYTSSRSGLFSRETFYPLTQFGISAVLILFGC